MNFTPLNGRIVVRRTDSERVSRGGIVIPDGAIKESQKGVILAASGPYEVDGKMKTPQVKAGDQILFPKYIGEEFNFDGEKVLLMKDTDVLGIIHDSPALAVAS